MTAHDFASFNADERGDIADLAQFPGDFFGNKLAIRENLEVAARVRAKDVEQLRMHEWFAAENAEETVAVGAGISDQVI